MNAAAEPVTAAPDAPVTAVLLCGGAGRRVGGVDKPLLVRDGQPLVEHVLARIRPQVERIVISANRHLAHYARYGTVVTDTLPGFAGPLAGIRAALEVCKTPWLLACPGDAPDLPGDLVERFRQALRNQPPHAHAMTVVPHDGSRLQPLPLLMHRSLAVHLQAYLDTGERSIHGWLATLEPLLARFPDAAAFRSLNRPADFGGADQPTICDCR